MCTQQGRTEEYLSEFLTYILLQILCCGVCDNSEFHKFLISVLFFFSVMSCAYHVEHVQELQLVLYYVIIFLCFWNKETM